MRSYQNELSKNYALDATAMGIMTEVIGAALGFQSPTDAVGKVIATIGNLTEQFSSARDSRGFFSHFYAHQQGGGSMNTTSPHWHWPAGSVRPLCPELLLRHRVGRAVASWRGRDARGKI